MVDDLGAGRFDRTGTYVLMLIGLFVAEGLFSGVRNRLMHVAGEWFVLRIRSDAYRSVQRLSLSYFEQNTTGDIMSRLSGDVDAIEDMLVHGTDDILVNAIRFVGITGMLIYLDWRIALAVAQINNCSYCLSAHSYIGKTFALLDEAEIAANRAGGSTDPKADAAVRKAYLGEE